MSSENRNQLGSLTLASSLLWEWLAASQRPRPWVKEELPLGRFGGVCLGQWPRHCWLPASLQPRGRSGRREQAGQRPPGRFPAEAGRHPARVSLFLKSGHLGPSKNRLAHVRTLAAGRVVLSDVPCLLIVFTRETFSSPAHEGWGGGQTELKPEMSFLFPTVQFKFHLIFTLWTNMYYTILGLPFQRCFNL